MVGARPHRPRRRRQAGLDPLDDRAHRLRLELRVHEQEVEGEVELVLALAVERHQLREVEHVGLPHEDPRRVRLVGDLAPAAQDVVDLGPVHGEHLLVPAGLGQGMIVRGRHRVVAQLAILDDAMGDVDAPARDPAVEPEAQDLVERLPHLLAPPVQVGLRRQEVVQVELAGGLVERPGRAAERAHPIVRWRAVGLRVGPDVEVAVPRVTAAERVLEPLVAVARVVGDEVEQDADAAAARLGDQLVEVLERAERRVDGAVVGDVVAPVVVRRGHRRVEPDAVDPQPLEVVEVRRDPAQVADPVPVRVREGTRIDLVQDAVAPPFRSPRHGGAAYGPPRVDTSHPPWLDGTASTGARGEPMAEGAK